MATGQLTMNNPILQAFICGAWFEAGLMSTIDHFTGITPISPTLTTVLCLAGIFGAYWYIKLLNKWSIRRAEDN